MGRGKKRKYDKSVYRSFALITQFGINMLVPIGMLTALGIWLDGKFGTTYWTIILFFVGAVAGGQNIYRMAKAIYAPERKGGLKEKQEDAHENGKSSCDGIEK